MWDGFLAWSDPSKIDRKNVNLFSICIVINWVRHTLRAFPPFSILSICAQSNFVEYIWNINIANWSSYVHIYPQNLIFFRFSQWCFKTLMTVKKLSAFSLFFLHSENTGKRVVCSKLNCLRIRGKKPCVHGEEAKRYETEDILVNNDLTKTIWNPYFLYSMGWIKPNNHLRSNLCAIFAK